MDIGNISDGFYRGFNGRFAVSGNVTIAVLQAAQPEKLCF